MDNCDDYKRKDALQGIGDTLAGIVAGNQLSQQLNALSKLRRLKQCVPDTTNLTSVWLNYIIITSFETIYIVMSDMVMQQYVANEQFYCLGL